MVSLVEGYNPNGQYKCRRLFKPDTDLLSDIARSSDPYVSFNWTSKVPLPYRACGPWIRANKPSDQYHRTDFLEALMKEVKGYWYYCLEIKQTLADRRCNTYNLRHYVRFEHLDDALMFKLRYL